MLTKLICFRNFSVDLLSARLSYSDWARMNWPLSVDSREQSNEIEETERPITGRCRRRGGESTQPSGGGGAHRPLGRVGPSLPPRPPPAHRPGPAAARRPPEAASSARDQTYARRIPARLRGVSHAFYHFSPLCHWRSIGTTLHDPYGHCVLRRWLCQGLPMSATTAITADSTIGGGVGLGVAVESRNDGDVSAAVRLVLYISASGAAGSGSGWLSGRLWIDVHLVRFGYVQSALSGCSQSRRYCHWWHSGRVTAFALFASWRSGQSVQQNPFILQTLTIDRHFHQPKGHGANCLLPDFCSISLVSVSRSWCHQSGKFIFLISIDLKSSLQCCADAVTLLGVVFGVICASKETHTKSLFSQFSILTVHFWTRALVRISVLVAFTMGVLKPLVKVCFLRNFEKNNKNSNKSLVRPAIISTYDFLGVAHYSGSAHIRETKKNALFRYSKHLQPSFRFVVTDNLSGIGQLPNNHNSLFPAFPQFT